MKKVVDKKGGDRIKRGAAGKAADFWDKEYGAESDGEVDIFKLSDKPGKDFLDFVVWLEKVAGKGIISRDTFFVDAGCGNGRHAIHLAKTYGARGLAYDLSSAAVEMGRAALGEGLKFSNNIDFQVRNIHREIPAGDSSVDLIIDAMASHVLKENERNFFLKEEVRVLQTGGYIFLKTFLRDGDSLAADLIYKYPAEEKNAYIHPKIGIYEFVPSERELVAFYENDFEIEKVIRSHFHKEKGKRRYIVMYLRKK